MANQDVRVLLDTLRTAQNNFLTLAAMAQKESLLLVGSVLVCLFVAAVRSRLGGRYETSLHGATFALPEEDVAETARRLGCELLADPLNDKPPLIVSIVHGTSENTTEPEWPRSGSRLRESMAVSLPPGTRFELIRWSGKNRHLDRLEAADLLRLHVRKVRYQYPAVPHVCIGYSHGGTALHWALADTAVELALMGYAFLSTPFLDVEHRQDAEKTAAYVGSLCSLILVLGLTGLLAYHWNLGFSGFIEVEWLVTILCLPLGFYLNQKFNRLRSAAEKFANTFPQPKCYVEKGIVIRTPGDEASIALSTISAIHIIRVQAAIRNESWSTALAKRASRLEVGFRRFFIEVVVPVSLWVSVAALTSVTVVVGFFFFWAGFGLDVARHSMFFGLNVEATPSGVWVVNQLRSVAVPSPQDGGERLMSHHSYSHPDVAVLLTGWVLSRLAARDAGGDRGPTLDTGSQLGHSWHH